MENVAFSSSLITKSPVRFEFIAVVELDLVEEVPCEKIRNLYAIILAISELSLIIIKATVITDICHIIVKICAL